MSETVIGQASAQVFQHSASSGAWEPKSESVARIGFYHDAGAGTYRMVGYDAAQQLVVHVAFTDAVTYEKTSDNFHNFSADGVTYGLNFADAAEAGTFATVIQGALTKLKQPKPPAGGGPPPPPPGPPPPSSSAPKARPSGGGGGGRGGLLDAIRQGKKLKKAETREPAGPGGGVKSGGGGGGSGGGGGGGGGGGFSGGGGGGGMFGELQSRLKKRASATDLSTAPSEKRAPSPASPRPGPQRSASSTAVTGGASPRSPSAGATPSGGASDDLLGQIRAELDRFKQEIRAEIDAAKAEILAAINRR